MRQPRSRRVIEEMGPCQIPSQFRCRIRGSSTTITAAHASILLATCGSGEVPMSAVPGRPLREGYLSRNLFPPSASNVASHELPPAERQSNHHLAAIQPPAFNISPSPIIPSRNLPFPHSLSHRSSYTSAGTIITNCQSLHKSGPFHNCPFCGCNALLEYPNHPWDHVQKRREVVQDEYRRVKPYLEQKRRFNYRRRQRKLNEHKERCTSKRCLRVKLEDFRHSWSFSARHNKHPRTKNPRSQSPSESDITPSIASGSAASAAHND